MPLLPDTSAKLSICASLLDYLGRLRLCPICSKHCWAFASVSTGWKNYWRELSGFELERTEQTLLLLRQLTTPGIALYRDYALPPWLGEAMSSRDLANDMRTRICLSWMSVAPHEQRRSWHTTLTKHTMSSDWFTGASTAYGMTISPCCEPFNSKQHWTGR